MAVKPEIGILTWDSEGNEGGFFHSRKAHVPSDSSGLTIGRGYDLRFRKQSNALKDFITSGIEPKFANLLASAAGLFGANAKTYLSKNSLDGFKITEQAQLKLFNLTYAQEEAETKRICTKADVERVYGKCDWGRLNIAIKTVLIDLKFRGDYTPKIRKTIQKHISKKDFVGFYKVINDRSVWPNVPQDRFRRRVDYFNNLASPFQQK